MKRAERAGGWTEADLQDAAVEAAWAAVDEGDGTPYFAETATGRAKVTRRAPKPA